MYIKYKLVIMLVASLLVQQVRAQLPHPDVSQIQITWQPVENRYDGKDQALSIFTLSGNIPAVGWKIYFNYGRTITPVAANSTLQTGHVNGGLYYLQPAADFKSLAVGAKLELPCVSNSWIVNSSDAPQGFYWVWNDDPAKGIPLNHFKVLAPDDITKLKRFANDKILSAEELYNLNERAKLESGTVSKIFPKPVHYRETEGVFHFSRAAVILSKPEFKNEAALLKADLNGMINKDTPVAVRIVRETINLEKDSSIHNNGYRLSVKPTYIVISAANATGIFYGIQSLKTLIDPQFYSSKKRTASISIPCVEVSDGPAFGLRGVMLDVARNFQSTKEIFKLIDLLALYKFNTLHLHLDDDEGWRLEIPTLPELTAVSSKRGHSVNEDGNLIPAYGSGPQVNTSSGSGYYTREQFIAILKYANQRHINVIPEVETPGHSRAAIKAMASRYKKFMALGDSVKANQYLLQSPGDASVYHSVQQWNDNVMDPALPSVYNFISAVTDDIVAMYKAADAPLATIHYGGDETPVGVWEGSPAFKALSRKDSSIKTPADLWDYFFSNINNIAKQRGLYFSGWEETGLVKTMINGRKRWQANPKFADQNFHINVWNNMLGNEDLGYRLANAGYKVVVSFVTNFYFDMAYRQEYSEPGFNWGGFINLELPFKFVPFDYLKNQRTDYLGRPLSAEVLNNSQKLTETGKQNIIGIQGMLWTETVKTAERLEYMYLPRLMALAERAWVKQPDWMTETDSIKAAKSYTADWVGFLHGTGRELVRLDNYAGGYQYRIPTPAFKISKQLVYANTDVPGFVIRYTTDGSVPDVGSRLYTKAVPYTGKMMLRAFDTKGRGSLVAKVTEGIKLRIRN